MCDICGDNRFELIEKYKRKLLDATNIEDSPEEMAVIDNILFRFWQMGWLERLELFRISGQPGDVISRQAAIDTLAEWNDEAINNRLNNLPSVDAAPIVRCKDCSKWCICHHSDDWFCADGTMS